MYYLITAYDGTDKDALERRMKVRPRHLENVKRVKEKGSVVLAGAITDDDGKPVGSYLILDFDSRELLEEYIATEPYVTEGVWLDIKAEPCKVAIKDDEQVGA